MFLFIIYIIFIILYYIACTVVIEYALTHWSVVAGSPVVITHHFKYKTRLYYYITYIVYTHIMYSVKYTIQI